MGLLSVTRQEKIALLVIFIIAILYAVWHIRNQRPANIDLGKDIGVKSRMISVWIEGAVVKPGQVNVPEGTSVADAIRAAGGFLPHANRDAVPMGAVIISGQRVVVPSTDASRPVSPGGSGLTNINTASKAELESLPGIGEELSKRIIEYRNARGPFRSIEDIMLVDGIGEGKFKDIHRLITVGN